MHLYFYQHSMRCLFGVFVSSLIFLILICQLSICDHYLFLIAMRIKAWELIALFRDTIQKHYFAANKQWPWTSQSALVCFTSHDERWRQRMVLNFLCSLSSDILMPQDTMYPCQIVAILRSSDFRKLQELVHFCKAFILKTFILHCRNINPFHYILSLIQ